MKTLLILTLALGAAACGGKNKQATSTVACNDAGNAFCWEAVGSASAMASGGYTQADCTGQPGTVVPSCPTANRIGTCAGNDVQPTGQVAVQMRFYAPWDATSATNQCTTLGGTFTPG